MLLPQASKGKQRLAFFTMPEYEAWKESASPGWTVKYYKGLGTSDKREAQEYFADIDQHRKSFVWQGARPLRMHTVHCHACMQLLARLCFRCRVVHNVRGCGRCAWMR